MKDDRKEFEKQARRDAIALGEDEALNADGLHLLREAGKHRYTYLWSWLGVPIIQVPSDVVAMQEIIWETKPDIIIETGIARGGSAIFLASMLQLLGRGTVVGVDIDIRAHNRDSIESHPLGHRVRLIEGSSTDPDTVARVKALIEPGAKVMVILDSDHSYAHVKNELAAYAPLVTEGQFLIVADTGLAIASHNFTPPHGWGNGNDPMAAMDEYLAESDRFEIDPVYNGKLLMTSSPRGYLRCVR